LENKNNRFIFLAYLIIKITNPTFLSILMLLLIAWTQSSSVHFSILWTGVILSFLVILPLAYVYLRFYLKKGRGVIRTDPTTLLKYHPEDILVISLIFGVPCLFILATRAAPVEIIYTFMAFLSCAFVTALINIFYRASFHLASIVVIIIMSAAIWGEELLTLGVLIPLIGWAKHRVHEHTMMQLVSGFFLAIIISSAILFIYE